MQTDVDRTDDLLHTLESRERAGCSSTVVASKQGKKRRRVAGDAKKLPDADAGRTLDSWVEVESLKRCEANYCTLVPPPRSTIAAAFSHDGTYLASTQYVTCPKGNERGNFDRKDERC